MGFSSIDDFISKITAGKFWRADFMQIYTGGVVVAGRWYDLHYFAGTPTSRIYGNYVKNGDFLGGSVYWTVGSGYWVYTPATHLMTRTANADCSTLSQDTDCVEGTTYSVVYTVARTAGGVTISLGGTNGTQRTSAGTFRENIVCGATAGAPLVITPDATYAGTVDVIGVTQDLAFTPCSDANHAAESGLWHGGNVSGDTKHLTNIGAWGNTTTSVPSVLMLIDVLGVYPRIVTNLATVQNLINTQTLPRYTDGKGVRAFYSIDAIPGANARNFAMTYTNEDDEGSRSLGALVAATASSIQSHIECSGIAANNFGPFLPLTSPDQGVKSVQSVQFSAASASAGTANLVLCRPIASLPITTAYVAAERDLMNQLPSLPRIYDGANLGFIIFAGAVIASGTQWQGYCDFSWG